MLGQRTAICCTSSSRRSPTDATMSMAAAWKTACAFRLKSSMRCAPPSQPTVRFRCAYPALIGRTAAGTSTKQSPSHRPFAVPRYFGERADMAADPRKPPVSRRVHIESDHDKSRFDEAPSIDLSHQANADQSNGSPSRHGNIWCHSSGAIASSRATASRLSRNAFGTGMPRRRRSTRFAWLCSPGSQIRSTPGSRRE